MVTNVGFVMNVAVVGNITGTTAVCDTIQWERVITLSSGYRVSRWSDISLRNRRLPKLDGIRCDAASNYG